MSKPDPAIEFARPKRAKNDYPPVLPHGKITKLFDGLYYVRGSVQFGPGITFNRVMTIVVNEQSKDVTLISTCRLNEEGLKELDALGNVTSIVRIGGFHGMDDPFYVNRYSAAKFYGIKGNTYHEGCEPHVYMGEGKENAHTFPPAATDVFLFRESKIPEVALLLPHNGGTLVTCDSVQNSTLGFSDPQNSTLATTFCYPMGFLGTAVIGPGWRKLCRKEGAPFDSFVKDFQRLLQLQWKHLIPGHGVPLIDNAQSAVATSVQETFRRKSTAERVARKWVPRLVALSAVVYGTYSVLQRFGVISSSK